MVGHRYVAMTRRYRFLLTPRWLGLLLVAVLLFVGCVALGQWQLARLESRHATNDLLARNAQSRPRPAAELLTVARGPDRDQQYARVRVTGRYDPDRQLLVRNRPYRSEVGYFVLTPLVTREGPALLVNRGWVPRGEDATSAPDLPPPPPGQVTVTGRLRPSEPASTTGTPPPGQVTRIDVSTIRAQLPYQVYGGYADLVAERPAPRESPARLAAPAPTEGAHLAYAFQWFLFGLLALGGYGVLARREAEDRLAAPPASGHRVVVRISG